MDQVLQLTKFSALKSSFFCFCFLYALFIFIFLIYFWLWLGLHCCAWAFSSCGERGLLFVVVCGLPIAVASPVAEHGL